MNSEHHHHNLSLVPKHPRVEIGDKYPIEYYDERDGLWSDLLNLQEGLFEVGPGVDKEKLKQELFARFKALNDLLGFDKVETLEEFYKKMPHRPEELRKAAGA